MKKIISALLALTVVLGMTIPVYAASSAAVAAADIPEPVQTTSSDKALETAVKTVKSRISIPDEYSDFNFYKYSSGAQSVYQLTWSGSSGSIYVSIQGNVITSYSKYADYIDSGAENAHFAKKTKAQLKTAADNVIKKLNPTVYQYIKVDADSYSSYVTSDSARFNVNRFKNNIKVSGNSGSITLNKDTGELMYFNIGWTDGASFKSPETALSADDIKKSYTELIGVKPVYRIITDYSDNKKSQKAILIYLPETSDMLDAFTGKISTFYGSPAGDEVYDDAAEDTVEAEAGTGAANVRLTPAELAAVEKEKELITADEAASVIMSDKYSGFTSDYALNSSYLRYDYYDSNNYYWDLGFTGKGGNLYGNARIDAKTGAIISYYCYDYNKSNQTVSFDEKAADALAEEALKAYCGEKFDEYRLTDAKPQTYTDYNTRKTMTSGKYYNYNRYVNDIMVENDYINLTVGADIKITNYSISYTDISFPSAKNMLSESKALESLYSQQEFDLYYITKYAGKKTSTALVYSMPDYVLDAVSGKMVDYSGNTIVKPSAQAYTDISKHSIKDIANKLAENGIKLPTDDGRLRPDSNITEADFITLMNYITRGGDFYPLYGARLNSASNALSKTISRRNAVKCMVTALGGNSFAELEGIYVSPFSDVEDDSGYAGYFALAKGLGVFGKNTAKSIKPDALITRADALTMIYNYLVAKK